MEVDTTGAKLWYTSMQPDQRSLSVGLGEYLQPGHPNHMSLEDARQAAYDAWLAKRPQKVDIRVIDDYGLRALMREIAEQPRLASITAIEIYIRLGGHRLRSLLQLRRSDVLPDVGGIMSPDNDRAYLIPTEARILELLSRQSKMAAAVGSDFLFAANEKNRLNEQTVRARFRAMAARIQAEGSPTEITLYDIRRKVEIWLSEKGVTQLTRDGIFGRVASRGHRPQRELNDGANEMRYAIEIWNHHLDVLMKEFH